MPFDIPFLSLLWPDESTYDKRNDSKILSKSTITDLRLDYILEQMNLSADSSEYMKKIFSKLCSDNQVLEYRQDILEELLKNRLLCETLLDFSNNLKEINQSLRYTSLWNNEYFRAVCYYNAIQAYIFAVSEFTKAVKKLSIIPESSGIKRLVESLAKAFESPSFKSTLQEIEQIRPEIEALYGMSLGVGVLKGSISEIMLLPEQDFEINIKVSVASRINDSLPDFAKVRNDVCNNIHNLTTITMLEQEFFKTMVQSRKTLFDRLLQLKDENNSSQPTDLMHLCCEIDFYLTSIKLINLFMEKGIKFCKPTILNQEDKLINLKGVCDVSLAFNEHIVKNPIEKIISNDCIFNENARIYIVTGPNSGGKTTFLRSVGLAQVFFQAGLFVPAESAQMSPVDCILTHFPRKEIIGDRKGKLGEEAERLSKLFENFSGSSMVLLNETFSSTQALDGYYLGCDLLKVLMEAGCIGIYVTHIHDLAYKADELNAEFTGASRLGTLSTCMDESNDSVRTYRILPVKPSGLSYSRGIVLKYGMSWEQLKEKIIAKEVEVHGKN